MQVLRGIRSSQTFASGCVATIGNFDGVHLGHQAIITQCREIAKTLALPVVVVVFEPQPREFFAPTEAPARLTRLREKVTALESAGADWVVCLPFNHQLRSLTASEFIEKILLSQLQLKHLVIGDDFRFGCDRKGDFALLQRVGEQKGFHVQHTDTVTVDGERVSSTRVRGLLGEGKLEQAALLLGRPFSMSGKVGHGQKLGRQLGVPTANIHLGRKRAPLSGVFVVEARVENGDPMPAVANLGMRPTVSGVEPRLEVHLLDAQLDLYSKRMEVTFLKKLRDEQKFSGLEALEAQLQRDIEQARIYLQQR